MTHVDAEPRTKDELVARMLAERDAWDALIAWVPEEATTIPGLPEGWSVKDVIAHVMAYERWTAAMIRGASTGEPPSTLELYGTEDPGDIAGMDLDRRNAAIRALYHERPLAEVLVLADRAFDDLVAAVETLPDDVITTPGAQDWTGGESLLRLIPEQSYGHYRQHLPDLRAWLAARADGTARP